MSAHEGRNEGKMSSWEAEKRVQSAVNEMETALNRLDGTPDQIDAQRHEYLASHFMLFLARTYEIVADMGTQASEDSQVNEERSNYREMDRG
jgi:hypothetical protein